VDLSAEILGFCREIHLSQKSKISAEKGAHIMQISAERCTPFCRNLRFLQRKATPSAISAEIQFRQRGAHISAEI
jgi:hypothetical protein